MSAKPLSQEYLESRAHQQREQIHRTAMELVAKVDETRQKLTLSYNLRRHFWAVAFFAAALSLVSGYALGVAMMRQH